MEMQKIIEMLVEMKATADSEREEKKANQDRMVKFEGKMIRDYRTSNKTLHDRNANPPRSEEDCA
jgi:hypothetical protein